MINDNIVLHKIKLLLFKSSVTVGFYGDAIYHKV